MTKKEITEIIETLERTTNTLESYIKDAGDMVDEDPALRDAEQAIEKLRNWSRQDAPVQEKADMPDEIWVFPDTFEIKKECTNAITACLYQQYIRSDIHEAVVEECKALIKMHSVECNRYVEACKEADKYRAKYEELEKRYNKLASELNRKREWTGGPL